MQQAEHHPQQLVGIHHHHPEDAPEQAPLMLLHQQNHHHHHQQQMEEHLGMHEDEEEEDEEEDDPGAVQVSMDQMPPPGIQQEMVGVESSSSRRQQQQQQQGRMVRGSPGGLQMPVLPAPCCRVDGCGEDLSTAGDYHRRHKVCKMHATSPKVINHGQEQRFCQQCSRFHSLAEFDEGKRSCRKRLAGHNERRRRHQPDALVTTSGESPPLPQGRESNKRPREWKSRGGRGGGASGSSSRRARSGSSSGGLAYTGSGTARGAEEEALMLRGAAEEMQSMSKRRSSAASVKSGDEPFSSMFSDAFIRGGVGGVGVGDGKGKERAVIRFPVAEMMERRAHEAGGGEFRDVNNSEVDTEMEQVKEGLDLGEGVIIPPLPLKRDGKLTLLKGWPPEGAPGVEELQLQPLRCVKEEIDKRAWQRGDDTEALIHCFWECPKVQPVWRWAGRQLTKLRGSKVKVELQQAVFGGKLESWASPEIVSVWKLLRGIIMWQIWLARKGKLSSGMQWTSNKVIRSSWVDLMMYAVQDWLEVLKKKEAGKPEDGYELRGKFDSKWLVNQFAGKRAEWSMVWKDPDDVLLD